jgi:hypothetical protein
MRLWMPNTSTSGLLAKGRYLRPKPAAKRELLSESAASNNARFNMPTPPKMRDLAHRLLAYEAGAIKTSKPMQSPTHPVYEKLGQSLVAFAGPTGFQLLAARALALARPEAPSLNTARASARRRKKAQKRVVGLESPQLLPCRRDFLQYLLLRSQVCFKTLPAWTLPSCPPNSENPSACANVVGLPTPDQRL